MTPFKSIEVDGNAISYIDFEDQGNLMCLCVDENTAHTLGAAFAKFHEIPFAIKEAR